MNGFRRPCSPVVVLLAATLALAILAAQAPAAAGTPAPSAPRSLILLVPDGCGPASLTLARGVAGRPLALDSILVGACETQAADSRVTDSAAGATALACGVRTRNGAIGMDSDLAPVGTLLEAARLRGKATGLVATSRITHATPAAFAAHVTSRQSERDIAAQMAEQGVDVILGGGRREFLPEGAGGIRRDGRDLLAEARGRGVRVVSDAAGLDSVPGLPVLGLFAKDHMSYGMERDPATQPSLTTMTRRALELLDDDPDGFFLMVEGSRPDHAAHDHDPATHVRELLEFDEAVRVAVGFARREGRTLVVAVADHETGGLTLGGRGGSGGDDWRPEALRAVRRPAGAIADLLRQGLDADSLLAADAGVSDLDPAERDTLDARLRRGGLTSAVGEIVGRRARVAWATGGHTGVDVPMHAFGAGAEAFRGVMRNDALGRLLAHTLGLDLDAATARLRAAGNPATAPGAAGR